MRNVLEGTSRGSLAGKSQVFGGILKHSKEEEIYLEILEGGEEAFDELYHQAGFTTSGLPLYGAWNVVQETHDCSPKDTSSGYPRELLLPTHLSTSSIE